ncbi:MAG TPA: hypothetical protein VFP50_07745 [Anaeromyxobacteraceae bacterium]|nr:hypothetical protein [Anaeromyxobacteraceae bacterium]
MRPRTIILALLALGVLCVLAAYLIVRWTEPPIVERVPVAPAEPELPPAPPGPPPSSLTPSEVADPAEALKLELVIEQRGLFRSLRDGFKGPLSPASRGRIEPPLRALWPGEPPAWKLTCRGRVCSVTGPGEASAWHAQLLADAGVAKVADRIAVDPDGADPVAFVVVTAGAAGSGDDYLARLEGLLRQSEDVAACLGRGSGTVEYELMVDETGVTWRTGGSAPPEVADCIGVALGPLLAAVPPPPQIKRASRMVRLVAAP